MFEDPWKKKVLCCLSGPTLNMRNATDQSGQETFDLAKWDIIVREKGKFILKRVQGDYQVQLKAESPAEAELWVQKLNAATALARQIPNNPGYFQPDPNEDRARQQEDFERAEAERAARERAELIKMQEEQQRVAQHLAELAHKQALERAQMAEIARQNAEREAAERAQQAELARISVEREAERARQAEMARLRAEQEAAEQAQHVEMARVNGERQSAEKMKQEEMSRLAHQAELSRIHEEQVARKQAEQDRLVPDREVAEAAARLHQAALAMQAGEQQTQDRLEKESAARILQQELNRMMYGIDDSDRARAPGDAGRQMSPAPMSMPQPQIVRVQRVEYHAGVPPPASLPADARLMPLSSPAVAGRAPQVPAPPLPAAPLSRAARCEARVTLAPCGPREASWTDSSMSQGAGWPHGVHQPHSRLEEFPHQFCSISRASVPPRLPPPSPPPPPSYHSPRTCGV
jgi:hypothetical protein